MVVPRAHDCITIFLGGHERYNAEFDKQPGTYWYALDYMESDDGTGGSMGLGSGIGDGQAVYDEYVEKSGKENADYLMEVMGAWQAHYKRAAFIDMGVGDGSKMAKTGTRQHLAPRLGLEKVTGDMVLVRRLVFGDWEKDFLVLQPGEQLKMTYDDGVIGCVLANA